jgi:succinoglycan biosynthesis transport protein ExoP
VEIRDYLRILRKSWVLIVVLALVSVAAAAAYSIVQVPQYSSSATVFVSTSASSSVSDLAQGNSFTLQRVKTYAELVTTAIVLTPVIKSLKLDMTTSDLKAEVTASAPLDKTLIEIVVEDADPERAAQIATAVSSSLAEVVQNIDTTSASATNSPVKLTLVQNAEVPTRPISPNVPLNVALGALIGLALGVGFAVLRDTLDNRLRSERDIRAITNVPILGGIAFDSNAASRPLIVHVDPQSPRAESFRSLRTNLQFLNVGRRERTFVITSSIESEGKSTTAANLAIALAEAGTRVLLVDADLRRPQIATYLGVEGAVGLTDLLIGNAEPNDVIQQWGGKKLFVLPAGKAPPNPSELLGSDAMVKLIHDFTAVFDVVLFDSPPLLPVTDAAILARIVGGTIVVCAMGRTHSNHLRGALAALEAVEAPVSGLVLSMVPTKGPDAYGYGSYGSYGYGSYGGNGSYASKTDDAASKP